MQLALAAAAALSGLGEDLGGTAALGGGLAETFQRLLPGTFFFFSFFFFPGVSDGDCWGEEDKEASAAGADAALWLSGRSVPARMSVCRVSPTVPWQERSLNDRRGSAWTSRMW